MLEINFSKSSTHTNLSHLHAILGRTAVTKIRGEANIRNSPSPPLDRFDFIFVLIYTSKILKNVLQA